jgi:hypothetical protein
MTESFPPRDVRFLRSVRPFFLLVDIGFMLYWMVTALHLLPAAYLYKDYQDPLLTAWNWSFAPLDLVVSATGIGSLMLSRKYSARAVRLAIVSLSLTSASGFQAISFWAIRGDFDALWWAPNLFLLLYPWFFLLPLLREPSDQGNSAIA